ncbi:hypothetical protein LEP1GSC108_1526 [Leptospira weilii str. UI 13098]|uniref:Uncharacterized protein n=1 Tax=Leptospira weilii str. UI 13098 TaxID=1088542 RepID=M6Q533_9LEPT|nr:hypothetical protein LEP1GSC108_1526 [Leptospira weilii str. UI 13098]
MFRGQSETPRSKVEQDARLRRGRVPLPAKFFSSQLNHKIQNPDSNANFGKAFRATLGAKKRFRGTGCSEAKVRRLGAKSSRDARLRRGRVTKFFSKKSLKCKLTT